MRPGGCSAAKGCSGTPPLSSAAAAPNARRRAFRFVAAFSPSRFTPMRRHWSHRLSAVFFAVWFGIVGLEPGALGTCRMHQSATGAMAAAMAAGGHHAGHAGHAAMAAHAGASSHGDDASNSPAKSPTDGDHAAHHCSCPGCCCSVAALAVPVVASHDVFVGEIATTHALPAVVARKTWADFVLPFATAPPRTHFA
jgi:hypothetical protein